MKAFPDQYLNCPHPLDILSNKTGTEEGNSVVGVAITENSNSNQQASDFSYLVLGINSIITML